MRHPFDGINLPKAQPAPEQNCRRSILKVFAGAIAALFGLSARSQAQTQNKGVLSLALGEAGGTALTQAFKEEAGDPTKDPTKMRNEEGGPLTTQALGEEGATTKALNEEGGVATTKALNEEAGKVTTLRVGEEGAVTNAVGEQGGITTRALGEEGNPPKLTQALKEDGKAPPKLTQALNENGGGQATTLAIGEEGGKD